MHELQGTTQAFETVNGLVLLLVNYTLVDALYPSSSVHISGTFKQVARGK
jgi:hypothetical protein